jgi:hypothetical protein
MKKYTFEIIDAENDSGDALLQFTPEFLEEQDWQVNDNIKMTVEGNALILVNLDKQKRESIHQQVP